MNDRLVEWGAKVAARDAAVAAILDALDEALAEGNLERARIQAAHLRQAVTSPRDS